MIGEILGWIGAIAFAVCPIPQAVKCWRQGHGEGISAPFLWVWLIGEISMLFARPLTFGWVPWLMVDLFFTITALFVIIRYRFWPKSK